MLSTANLAGGGDALMLFRPSSVYYAGELETVYVIGNKLMHICFSNLVPVRRRLRFICALVVCCITGVMMANWHIWRYNQPFVGLCPQLKYYSTGIRYTPQDLRI